MKNIADLTTALRTCLIFLIIYLLNSDALSLTILGTVLLILAAIMDGLDGYLARKYCGHNKFGSLIDTLGDRITENLLLIFFAYKHLISFWIPLIFVARSFISDFIRLVCFKAGVGTFEINRSTWGFNLVASKTSRTLYLVFKILVFLLGCGALCLSATLNKTGDIHSGILFLLKGLLIYSSWVLVAFNLLRFTFLLYDSRSLLKKELVD